jgi:hypothetical protein
MKLIYWLGIALIVFIFIKWQGPELILKSIPQYPGSSYVGLNKSTWPDSYPAVNETFQSSDSLTHIVAYYKNNLKSYSELDTGTTDTVVLKFKKIIWNGSVVIEDQGNLRKINIEVKY